MCLNDNLFNVLVCPKCKGELKHLDTQKGFACVSCNLFYAIEDEIPNFLIEEAAVLNKED